MRKDLQIKLAQHRNRTKIAFALPGAAVGAVGGGLIGAATGGPQSNTFNRFLGGAAVGAGVGGAGGYALKQLGRAPAAAAATQPAAQAATQAATQAAAPTAAAAASQASRPGLVSRLVGGLRQRLSSLGSGGAQAAAPEAAAAASQASKPGLVSRLVGGLKSRIADVRQSRAAKRHMSRHQSPNIRRTPEATVAPEKAYFSNPRNPNITKTPSAATEAAAQGAQVAAPQASTAIQVRPFGVSQAEQAVAGGAVQPGAAQAAAGAVRQPQVTILPSSGRVTPMPGAVQPQLGASTAPQQRLLNAAPSAPPTRTQSGAIIAPESSVLPNPRTPQLTAGANPPAVSTGYLREHAAHFQQMGPNNGSTPGWVQTAKGEWMFSPEQYTHSARQAAVGGKGKHSHIFTEQFWENVYDRLWVQLGIE